MWSNFYFHFNLSKHSLQGTFYTLAHMKAGSGAPHIILPADQIDPLRWDAFVAASPQGSVYADYGWASAVASGWKAIILEKGGDWRAVLPFLPKKKYGIQYILQPPFCQTWGPILKPLEESSTYTKFSLQHKLLTQLAEAMPKVGLYHMHCHPSIRYLLPFHSAGFEIQTRYTHRLQLHSTSTLIEALSPQGRRKLRKSEKASHHLSSGQIDTFLALVKENNAQGTDVLGGIKSGEKLLRSLAALPGVSVHLCSTKEGEPLAAGIFAHDAHTTYYIGGAIRPGKPDDGAMYALMVYAMQEAKRRGCQQFDFEGSMIPGIARFFRQFGATPTAYFSLHKNRLPLPLRWIHA